MDADDYYYTGAKFPVVDLQSKSEKTMYKIAYANEVNLSDVGVPRVHADDIYRADGGKPTVGNATGGGAYTDQPLYHLLLLGSVLGLLDLVTILGNALVCVTITTIRRLRTTTNFFIFSLALSDFLLGCLVLPFSILNSLYPDNWPLGAIFCNLYTSMDVMLCTVSILNLFVISLDRYFAITHPLRYEMDVTSEKVISVIVGMWFFSAIIAFVPIHVGWNTADGRVQNWDAPWLCVLEGNALYVVLVSITTYFVPLIIMCTVYSKVYAVAKRQAKAIQKMMIVGAQLKNGKSDMTSQVSSNGGAMSTASHKAIFTLASVVAAYAVCWVPYFVLFTARPFVPEGFNYHVDLFTLWLGYANSALNPIIYAFLNREFRYGFLWVLCPRVARLKQQRATNCAPQYV